MATYRTSTELPVDLKKVKEEILSTAWKETPPAERVQKREPMDMFIEHYLLMHFNPGKRTILRTSPEDTLSILQGDALSGRRDAEISTDQVKSILHKHAAQAPAAKHGV